jgi:hypothetical protein
MELLDPDLRRGVRINIGLFNVLPTAARTVQDESKSEIKISITEKKEKQMKQLGGEMRSDHITAYCRQCQVVQLL